MSYDGRLMRQALARFDEDKQRRAENFRARERAVYTKCPRIEEIDRELSHDGEDHRLRPAPRDGPAPGH